MALTVMVSYDISRDSRRARVAAMVQAWGDRIQKSVYICTLESQHLNELMSGIADAIDPDVDSVYFVRQCRSCWGELVVMGQVHPPAEGVMWEVL